MAGEAPAEPSAKTIRFSAHRERLAFHLKFTGATQSPLRIARPPILKFVARIDDYARILGVRKHLLFFTAILTLFAALIRADTVREIRLTTVDDLGLSAAYYPVSTNSAAAVILLHSYGKTKDEWGSVPILFQRNGIAVFTFDLRGHGDSNRRLTANGVEIVEYQKFGPKDFKNMLIDVNQAYDWLASQPGIDKHRIAIIGSSIGANLALRYAAFNDEIAGLILLSPGIFYRDLRTDDVITRYGNRPLRIVVGREDPFPFESSKKLIALRQQAGQSVESNELLACTGNLQGAAMLTGVTELPSVVFAWLDRILAEPPMVGELHTNVAVSVTTTNQPGTSPQRVQGNHNR